MFEYHVHIRSTDQFKEIGVHEKNDRSEINSGRHFAPTSRSNYFERGSYMYLKSLIMRVHEIDNAVSML